MNNPKITLKYEDETQTITHEIINTNDTWDTHLQSMINFLRGIGYVIPTEEDRV